jgi:superfamily II DNA helicase RecQ
MLRNPQNGDRPSPENLERQEDAVRSVVQYCQNISECRRVQLLQYFGESFDPKECRRRCDNCDHDGIFTVEDVTKEAKDVLTLVKYFQNGRERVTFKHCQAVFRGANTSPIRERQHDKHPLYGAGRHMSNELREQLFQKLLAIEGLNTVSIKNQSGFHHAYVEVSAIIVHLIDSG